MSDVLGSTIMVEGGTPGVPGIQGIPGADGGGVVIQRKRVFSNTWELCVPESNAGFFMAHPNFTSSQNFPNSTNAMAALFRSNSAPWAVPMLDTTLLTATLTTGVPTDINNYTSGHFTYSVADGGIYIINRVTFVPFYDVEVSFISTRNVNS